MRSPLLRLLALVSLCLALMMPLTHAQEGAKWDVCAPPGPSIDLPIDVRRGTWMNVDVAPDGRELVFDLLGDIYKLPIEGGEAQAIASGVAWEMQPRFSPDGSRIAFTSDASGGDNLWLMAADGSARAQLSHEDLRLLSSPAWTPDGQWVAGRKHFTSRRSLGAGEVWIYHTGLAGKASNPGLQLTTKPTEQKDLGEPAFSPDGRWLYYSWDATPGSTFEYSKDSNKEIYRIDRLERTTGEIETVAGGPGGAVRPTPSPDGHWLAYVKRVRFETTLWVLDLASGAARELCGDLERDMQETWAIHGVYPSLAWTPDSKELVFYARGQLWRQGLEEREARAIPFHVQDTRRIQTAVRSEREAAPESFHVRALQGVRVAPDGERAVYQALGQLWSVALDAGKPTGAPQRLTTARDEFESSPSFSRDGRWVAYASWNDERLGAIKIVPATGGTGRNLTFEPGHYTEPAFAPDNSWIAWRKFAGGGLLSPLWSREPGIWGLALREELGQLQATGAAWRLSSEGTNPLFGATAERLFVLSVEASGAADRRALLSMDRLGGARETQLVSEGATSYALSADGKWVAFVEGFQAWLAPLVDTGREQSIGPKSSAWPLVKLSLDAGENLQFSGDCKRVHWSLGPELFTRELDTAFESAVDPRAPTPGVDISFEARQALPEGRIALVGARAITLEGDKVIEDSALVIDGNRIAAIGPRASTPIPSDARVIDASGLTLMPGLIDVHAHGPQASEGITPQQNWAAHANLAFGVTTIHDPSHDTNAIFAASELARVGAILAPRTFSTGTILYGAAGSFKAQIDSLEDARSHLRRLQAVGAFSVKSYNQPRRDQRQQVLAAARELGMLVVPEGGSTLQHNLTMIIDGHTGIEHSLPVERIYEDVLAIWAPSAVAYTPTLIVGYGGIWGENDWYQHTEVWKDERLLNFVPRELVDARSRRRSMAPEEEYNTRRSASIAGDLVNSGGHVQLGAHGQLAGLGAHWELSMLGQGGLSPLQALRAATLDGARYLGLQRDLGSLEVGKLADLIALEQNPLDNLRNSSSLRWTMLNGRLYDARTLAPLDGRGGEAPHYHWQRTGAGLGPGFVEASCAGCGNLSH